MATKPPMAAKPVLQKPPGYRDPGAPPVKPPQQLRRPTHLPPSLRHPGKRRHRNHRRSICCCILFFLLCALLLLSIAAALSYLYFQPRFPSFHLQSLNATRLRISSSDSLDVAISAKIITWNPNTKIGIVFGDGVGHLTAEDQDGDVELGNGQLTGFYLQQKSAGSMVVQAGESGVLLDDAVAQRMRNGYKGSGVKVKAELEVGMGVRVKGKNMWKVPVKVACAPMRLKVVGKKGGGASVGAMVKCQVYLFRWFSIN
ncbi:NDR1/HIN1-like protein 2 isoform X2 [Carex rostrata]